MIRFKRITQALLDNWLALQSASSSANYSLRLWGSQPTQLAPVKDELKQYVDEALDDARKRLRKGFEDDLSPYAVGQPDPADNFPGVLHRNTLQGYLGEILAGLAIEHWGAHGQTTWSVPALFFRFHDVEFQHLEAINQRIRDGETYISDESRERRPGHTGDDGLAFILDSDGKIVHVVSIEAKCLSRHNTASVADAHVKLSNGQKLQVGVRELIELLSEYTTEESNNWQQSLLEYRKSGFNSASQYDSVSYATGDSPSTRITWISSGAPHSSYTGSHNLEVMEFHFDDLSGLIDMLFREDM